MSACVCVCLDKLFWWKKRNPWVAISHFPAPPPFMMNEKLLQKSKKICFGGKREEAHPFFSDIFSFRCEPKMYPHLSLFLSLSITRSFFLPLFLDCLQHITSARNPLWCASLLFRLHDDDDDPFRSWPPPHVGYYAVYIYTYYVSVTLCNMIERIPWRMETRRTESQRAHVLFISSPPLSRQVSIDLFLLFDFLTGD